MSSTQSEKVVLSHTTKGSYDDDHYYHLVFNEDRTTATIEHSWHKWRPNGIDEGSRKITIKRLAQLSPEAYEEAVRLQKAQGFRID